MNEEIISNGINLTNIETEEELMNVLSNSEDKHISAKVILDLKDRVERFSTYLEGQTIYRDLIHYNKRLVDTMKDISTYVDSKVQSSLNSFSDSEVRTSTQTFSAFNNRGF